LVKAVPTYKFIARFWLSLWYDYLILTTIEPFKTIFPIWFCYYCTNKQISTHKSFGIFIYVFETKTWSISQC